MVFLKLHGALSGHSFLVSQTPYLILIISRVDQLLTASQTYDTDANILQMIDSQHFLPLFDILLTDLQSRNPTLQGITLIDYGCGTCRNTATIAMLSSSPIPIIEIEAMEPSPAMLEIGQRRMAAFPESSSRPSVSCYLLPPPDSSGKLPLPVSEERAQVLVSTLVLEHVSLSAFFEVCRRAVGLGGYVLITNMHDEMGGRSRAGFLANGGEKVQGVSFVYSLKDVVQVGAENGFEVVDEGREVGVDDTNVEGLGKRGKKWLGCKVWFGVVLRKV